MPMPDHQQPLKPSGTLTIVEVAEFRSTRVDRLSHEGSITLDVARVNRVDTAGLQVILAAARSGQVTVEGASDEVRTTMHGVGVRAPASHH